MNISFWYFTLEIQTHHEVHVKLMILKLYFFNDLFLGWLLEFSRQCRESKAGAAEPQGHRAQCRTCLGTGHGEPCVLPVAKIPHLPFPHSSSVFLQGWSSGMLLQLCFAGSLIALAQHPAELAMLLGE